jgi:heptosyltransferase III
LKNPKKILIVIQRSNGDVFMSASTIKNLFKFYDSPVIDLLVNDDTLAVAKLIPFVNKIHTFSYQEKKKNRWKQEKNIFFSIFRKYDLSICLTASDRSVLYAIVSAKKSISAVEKASKKSWWKKYFISQYYFFDSSRHILLNNLEPLKLLKINYENIHHGVGLSGDANVSIQKKLKEIKVSDFFIFHPSTQYRYKIYPENLRNILLDKLSKLGVPIIVTGGNSPLDDVIKKQLPKFENIFDFIGATSLEEYIALSKLSLGYIGMDTLNMHIAASQNKRIFAIFGPTNLSMWSPWSNQLKLSANSNQPVQTYGNVTIFQANLPCVACGKAGCSDNHGNSDCLDKINPMVVFSSINNWHNNYKDDSIISITNENEMTYRKVLLYIVYGEDQTYYDGAVFSFMSFMHWSKYKNQVEVVVLTEKPEKFSSYPVKTLLMTDNQKNDWSLNGDYHFRIKNRGLAYVMDQLNLVEGEKILFFDTDTYFHKSPLPLFDLINSKQALFYLNEGLIYERKRFNIYVKSLNGKKIKIDNLTYELSRDSALWGSLMVGIMPNMRHSLDWADKLMLKFYDKVQSHTIEPFALSESLLRDYSIVEGKKFVSLYSTSRKKNYAKEILTDFFKQNQSLSFEDKVKLTQKVKLKRPIRVVLKQRLQRLIRVSQ